MIQGTEKSDGLHAFWSEGSQRDMGQRTCDSGEFLDNSKVLVLEYQFFYF